MASFGGGGDTLTALDGATRALVRASAALAAGSEPDVRRALELAAAETPHPWMEELLLQTYLFAGFPRALNGMRAWRRFSTPVREHGGETGSDGQRSREDLRRTGEEVCAAVYGSMYERLRMNVRDLHPLLDDWMIVEGYGKVLSRPQLDLPRRELCIVAACAATGQDRQLQSHLHGARNVGVPVSVIGESLDALTGLVPAELLHRAGALWNRIRNDVH